EVEKISNPEPERTGDPPGFLASCSARPSIQPPGVLCRTAPPQMVAWYTFDELSTNKAGDTAKETASNWNDVENVGKLSAATVRVPGKVGYGAVNVVGG